MTKIHRQARPNDFQDNELLNVVLQKLIAPPIVNIQGKIYYDSVKKIPFFSNGVEWVPFFGKAVQYRYPDQSSLIADQSIHVNGFLYYQQDEDIYYEYLGTTNSDLTDYNPIGGSGIIQAGAGLSIDNLGKVQLGNEALPNIFNVDLDEYGTSANIFRIGYRDITTNPPVSIFNGFVALKEPSVKEVFGDEYGIASNFTYKDDSTNFLSLLGIGQPLQVSSLGTSSTILNILGVSNGSLLGGDFSGLLIKSNDTTKQVSSVFVDEIEEFGLKYASDYSANGTLDPRWIPDWGAVTGAIAGASHDPVTLGSPLNGLSLVGQQLSIGLASSGVTGALSGTDWNTFNGKIGGSIGNSQLAYGNSVGEITSSADLIVTRIGGVRRIQATSSLRIETINDNLSLNGNNSLSLLQGGVIKLDLGTNFFRPRSDNALDLGQTTFRYRNIYVNNVAVNLSSSPTNTLDVNGTTRIRQIDNLGTAATEVIVPDATGVLFKRTVSELLTDGSAITGTIASGQVAFGTGVNTIGGDNGLFWDNVNKRLRINQLTDAGFLLDVNGTTRISGSFTQANNTRTNTVTINASGVILYTSSTIGSYLRVESNNVVSVEGQRFRAIQRGINAGSIIANLDPLDISVIPAYSSGTNSIANILIRSTINNTGTYVGTVRGIYYNPVLTSLIGTTHIAIETVSGNVIFGSTSGNMLLGTTTDSGHRLNVNGEARIQTINNLGTAATVLLTKSATGVISERTLTEIKDDLGISPSSFQRDKFIYSGSNIFTITRNTPNAVMVFLNGQKLQFTDDWSISGTSVTVTTPLLTGDEISIEYFYSTPDVVSSNLNGTGTANYLTKWNGAAELGVSLIQDNGSLVTLPAATDIPAVAATTDTDKFVVLDGNRLKFRTGSEVLSDIGGASTSDNITAISLTTTTLTLTRAAGNLTASIPTWNQNTTGSAATLTTARTLTIGSTGKTFNGSANVSWSLSEIGAAASSHNQAASTITAGTFGSGNFVFPGNLDINGQISSPSNAKGNSGTGTVTFNWNDGNMQTVTLTGNCTFAFSNPKSGGVYQIIITRDATANRTINWPAGIKWGGGIAWQPSAANTIDIVTISYDGTTYFAVVTTDMKTI